MGLQMKIKDTCKNCGADIMRDRSLLDALGFGYNTLSCPNCADKEEDKPIKKGKKK